jgi:hypothetical protein
MSGVANLKQARKVSEGDTDHASSVVEEEGHVRSIAKLDGRLTSHPIGSGWRRPPLSCDVPLA